MDNAFEGKDEPIPEVEEPIKSAREIVLDSEIARIQKTNDSLRALGLHRTADLNTGKLQRLLQEKRDLQEG